MKFIQWLLREKSIFDYFRREPKLFPGLLLPTQDDIDNIPKLDDVTTTIAPVTWKLLEMDKVPTYPMYSQDGSGSCVAMSWSLIASILYYMRTGITLKFSPAWIYQHRINTGAGMIGTDVSHIASTEGMLPHDLMPCMDMSELAINSVPIYPWYKEVAKVFAMEDKLVQLPTKDLETIVSTMQVTGKPVNVWYEVANNEWQSEPVAIVSQPSARHSVVAIDYGLWNGKKCLVVQDSWGSNSTIYKGKRIITEDFHNKRNIFTAYPRRFKFDVSDTKGIFNGSIMSFQECMQSIGLFPQGVQFVENWGPLTRQACIKYQKLNNIPQTGILDTATKKLLLANFR